MAASRVPGLDHYTVRRLASPFHIFLISEFLGHYARRSHFQDNEGDLTVSLTTVWDNKVRELRLRSQGVKVFSGYSPVLADCVVNIPKCLDGVPLAAEVLIY
ncbi:MAG: hypothetical protein AB2692_21870 [Candidatus Thiodiazotropha sp.]